MYLVHESATGRRRVLAADVETADSLAAKTRGLMGRASVPDDYALVFRFGPSLLERVGSMLPGPLSGLGTLAARRSIHMLFVRVPLDVVWLRDGEVVHKRTLEPWRGVDAAPADTVVELAGGGADGVEPGDRVLVRDSLAGGVARDWRHAGRRRRRDGWARGRRGGHDAVGGGRPGGRGGRSTRTRRRRGRRRDSR